MRMTRTRTRARTRCHPASGLCSIESICHLLYESLSLPVLHSQLHVFLASR